MTEKGFPVQRPSAVGRRSGEDQRASAVDTLIGQATSVKKLREIHLEPESPFQAPAGHIPGPGGIKLGPPAPKFRPNYLIINTGRFQVNFTKAGIKTQHPETHLLCNSASRNLSSQKIPHLIINQTAHPCNLL